MDKAVNLEEAIGNTPLLALEKINPFFPRVKIFAKLEAVNPGGSIKDRTALFLIREGEKSGKLKKGKVILEPTSGNTGISLAMLGAYKGYAVELVMPECVSLERRKILEAFGAKLILTPGKYRTDGSIKKAEELFSRHPERYFFPNQYKSKANVLAHYQTTGPEIWQQTKGKIDVFCAGMGTTGTLMGTGKFLKEKNEKIKIIGLEPEKGHAIQGLKNMEESLVPNIFQPDLLDDKLVIGDEESFQLARQLALKEGLLLGISSGAALAGALKIAKKIKKGTIVTVFPDRGERYLSAHLFRSYCARCNP